MPNELEPKKWLYHLALPPGSILLHTHQINVHSKRAVDVRLGKSVLVPKHREPQAPSVR